MVKQLTNALQPSEEAQTPQAANVQVSVLATVSKLLFNAWNAEYALRLKPISSDRDYLNASLNWLVPEAYFAALFSTRAVLAMDEINIANPETLEKLLVQWVKKGKYGAGFTNGKNPLDDLFRQRMKAEMTLPYLSGPEAAALHVKLTETVHALAIIHETYILHRLGESTFRQLINSLPDHLRDGFVGARATFLLSND